MSIPPEHLETIIAAFDAATEWRKLYESRHTRRPGSLDELNMLIERLTAAWGNVIIECSGKGCEVDDFYGVVHQAPTLLEALRLAVEANDANR